MHCGISGHPGPDALAVNPDRMLGQEPTRSACLQGLHPPISANPACLSQPTSAPFPDRLFEPHARLLAQTSFHGCDEAPCHSIHLSDATRAPEVLRKDRQVFWGTNANILASGTPMRLDY